MTGQSDGDDGSNVHPAILVFPRGGEPKDSYPHPDEVTDVISEAFEATGWGTPTDILVDVRVDEFPFQDEVPPEPPVDVVGVVVALSQCPVTRPFGYDGPFQIALDALADEYGETMEIAIDAMALDRASAEASDWA